MARFLMSVAAVAVVWGVGAGTTAEASGPKGNKGGTGTTVNRVTVQRLTVTSGTHVNVNLRVSTGVRFAHGTFFRGSQFGQFGCRSWSNSYRCWVFYCQSTNCWYYWSGLNGCYFPMNYAGTVAPNGVLPTGVDTLPDQTPPGQTPPPAQLPTDQVPPMQPPAPMPPVQ